MTPPAASLSPESSSYQAGLGRPGRQGRWARLTRSGYRALLGCGLLWGGCIGCSDEGGTKGGGLAEVIGESPTTTCGSVRLTSYGASDGGWCEFDRTAPMLPESVRQGLTLAIAEPYNGSSYGGVSGEACGECWEVTSLTQTRIVMVHDLCPVQGNPICNGSHFHFDLASETAEALELQGLDEASARRVPCPVTGNAFLQILDRNEWGYLRFAVINHRIPVRQIEFRAADETTFYPAERSGGAWHVLSDGEMFASEGAGGVFRITSAQGEVLELPNTLDYGVAKGDFFDLGAQLTDQEPAEGAQCVFLPPAGIYVDGYGGIDQVRWMMNPWSSASPKEVRTGCVSGSCLQIKGMGSGAGFHIYYRQSFTPSTFTSLSLSLRTDSEPGELSIAASGPDGTCTETVVTVDAQWQEAVIDLATSCADVGEINSVSVFGNSDLVLMLDNVRWVLRAGAVGCSELGQLGA
jgi:hypothetical protein